MKIGDTVKFLDQRTRGWHVGELTSLDEVAQIAHVDCEDCGGDKAVSLCDTPLFLVRSAAVAKAAKDPSKAYVGKLDNSDGSWRKNKQANAADATPRPPVETPAPKKVDTHSAEYMREIRRKTLEQPRPCEDCHENFVRTSSNQKRCPECQGRRLKKQQSDWYLRKKAAKGTERTEGTKVTPDKPVAAPAAPMPIRTLPPTGCGWLAFAARHRHIAELAEQIAGLMDEGGAA